MFRHILPLSLALLLPLNWALQGCGLQNNGPGVPTPLATAPVPGTDAKDVMERACAERTPADADANDNLVCDRDEPTPVPGTTPAPINGKDDDHWYKSPWVISTAVLAGAIEVCRSDVLNNNIDCTPWDPNLKKDTKLEIPIGGERVADIIIEDQVTYVGTVKKTTPMMTTIHGAKYTDGKKIRMWDVDFNTAFVYCIRGPVVATGNLTVNTSTQSGSVPVERQVNYRESILAADEEDKTLDYFITEKCRKIEGAWMALERKDKPGLYYISGTNPGALGWTLTSTANVRTVSSTVKFYGLGGTEPLGQISFLNPSTLQETARWDIPNVEPSLSGFAVCNGVADAADRIKCKMQDFLGLQDPAPPPAPVVTTPAGNNKRGHGGRNHTAPPTPGPMVPSHANDIKVSLLADWTAVRAMLHLGG